MKLLTYVKDVQEELQEIDQIVGNSSGSSKDKP
jgi:hypothetical protein